MTYQNKPGQFSLFKNDRKQDDSHPDYRGQGVDLSGREVWVSAWINQSKEGKKFMSCMMKPKESVKHNPQQSIVESSVPDDDIPF